MSENPPASDSVPPHQRQREINETSSAGDQGVSTARSDESYYSNSINNNVKKQTDLDQHQIDIVQYDDEKMAAEHDYEPEEGKTKRRFNYSEFYGRHRKWFQ